MGTGYCISCLFPLPAGEACCPHCGFRSDPAAAARTGTKELPPLQELSGGRYVAGRALGQTEEEILYLCLDRKTGKRLELHEFFPDAGAQRAEDGIGVRWQLPEKECRSRQQAFARSMEAAGKTVFSQNRTLYAVEDGKIAVAQERDASSGAVPKQGRVRRRSRPFPKKPVLGAAAAGLVLLFFVLAALMPRRDSGTEWIYRTEDGLVTIIGSGSDASALELPAVLEGCAVAAIGPGAFRENLDVVSVVIPEGVTEIGREAFAGCVRLETVVIPESVTSLGAGAFQNCRTLRSVVLPSGITAVGDFTFFGCESLQEAELPEGLARVGVSAFENCRSLRELSLPEGVSVLERAFANCTGLVRSPLGAQVSYLSASAFEGCLFADDISQDSAAAAAVGGVLRFTPQIEPQYEAALDFSEHLAAVKQQGKWGYIDEDGAAAVPFDYALACPFQEGHALVALASELREGRLCYQMALVDSGNHQIPFTSPEGGPLWVYAEDLDPPSAVVQGGFAVLTPASSQWHFPNYFGTDGAMLSLGAAPNGSPWEACGWMQEGTAPVRSGSWIGWVDPAGALVYAQDFGAANAAGTQWTPGSFDRDMAFVYYKSMETGETWGFFIRRDFSPLFSGELYGGPAAEDGGAAYPFFGETGLAVLRRGGSFGAIDMEGETRIPFVYDVLMPSAEGLFLYREGGKYGYLSAESLAPAISPRFALAGSFRGGFAAVWDGEETFLIDRRGNRIEGSETLDLSSCFVYGPEGERTGIRTPGEYLMYREGGTYGFFRLRYTPEPPGEEELLPEAAAAVAAGLVPVELQNLYQCDITRRDMCVLMEAVLEQLPGKPAAEIAQGSLDEQLRDISFSDTADASVLACAALGIVNGTQEGAFRPYAPVTRQAAAAMLRRSAALLGAAEASGAGLPDIADSGEIAAPLLDAVYFAVGRGLLDCDESGAFRPEAAVSREEAFAAVYRLSMLK